MSTVTIPRLGGPDIYPGATFAVDGDGCVTVYVGDEVRAWYGPGVHRVLVTPDEPTAAVDGRAAAALARIDSLIEEWGRIDAEALLPAGNIYRRLTVARRPRSDDATATPTADKAAR